MQVKQLCYINSKVKGTTREFHINNSAFPILIDNEDWKRIRRYSWVHKRNGPIIARIEGKQIYLTRFILNITDSKIIITHKNKNPFDNRKNNLEIHRIKEVDKITK